MTVRKYGSPADYVRICPRCHAETCKRDDEAQSRQYDYYTCRICGKVVAVPKPRKEGTPHG